VLEGISLATTSVYANVVNLRTTQTDLVLEFGSFFPDRVGQFGPPSDYKPEIRVVMNIAALEVLVKSLQQAQQQQQQQVKPAPGFKPTQ
jgi:hypothetical protein